MYIPGIYRADSSVEVEAYVRKYNFATLTGNIDGRPHACHLPLILDDQARFLHGHVAKGNDLALCFDGNTPLLAIFMHEHAYISSSWYDHVNVPTWNYIAVHIEGYAKALEGAELEASIQKLVDHFEAGRNKRFHMSDMGAEMLQAHLDGLVGFKMTIDNVEAAFKLSQNRNEHDFKEILDQLLSSDDPLAHKVAEAMKKKRNL